MGAPSFLLAKTRAQRHERGSSIPARIGSGRAGGRAAGGQWAHGAAARHGEGQAQRKRRGSAGVRVRCCTRFFFRGLSCVCVRVRALCARAGLTAGVAWLPLRREGYEGWTTRSPHGARAGRLRPVAVFLLGRRLHGGLLGRQRREARGPREWPIAVWCDALGPGRVCGCVTGATVGCVSPARARGLSGWHLRGTCGGCDAQRAAERVELLFPTSSMTDVTPESVALSLWQR